jgi:hypothetical protein
VCDIVARAGAGRAVGSCVSVSLSDIMSVLMMRGRYRVQGSVGGWMML